MYKLIIECVANDNRTISCNINRQAEWKKDNFPSDDIIWMKTIKDHIKHFIMQQGKKTSPPRTKWALILHSQFFPPFVHTLPTQAYVYPIHIYMYIHIQFPWYTTDLCAHALAHYTLTTSVITTIVQAQGTFFSIKSCHICAPPLTIPHLYSTSVYPHTSCIHIHTHKYIRDVGDLPTLVQIYMDDELKIYNKQLQFSKSVQFIYSSHFQMKQYNSIGFQNTNYNKDIKLVM